MALVEKMIDESGRPAPRGRRVVVNLAESPLGWLAARGLVTPRQSEAGERLRGDYERAQLAASVTMRWAPGTASIAARRRFDAAVAAAGPGLADILWRVVCAGEAVPAAERTLGWPSRSGRLVLTLALDRVADHYGLH